MPEPEGPANPMTASTEGGRETFVLTLKLDAASFERLDGLRRQYFPAALNRLPAHLTLLHQLRAEQIGRLLAARSAFLAKPPLALEFTSLRPLGQGVAIAVRSDALDAMRGAVVSVVGGTLTRQDQQRFRAHVTVQNKVSPQLARQTLAQLEAHWVPWRGSGEALMIWRYLGGPWGFEHALTFAGH